MPAEPLNVVVQDPENANILYVGSDHGLYTSIDGGKSFMALYKNLPAVAVHDLVVHPREKDLVVGTHGRSIYIANIEHVQQLTDSILSETTHFFPVEPITWSKRWGKKRSMWDEPETPKIEIAFYLKKKADFLIQIQTESGMILTEWTHTGVAGLNYTDYDLSIDVEKKGTLRTALHDKNPEADPVEIAENGKLYLREGTYKIVAKIDGKAVESELKIEAPKKKKRGE